MGASDLLIPRPQKIEASDSTLTLGKRANVSHTGTSEGMEPGVRKLLALLSDLGVEVADSPVGARSASIRLGIDRALSIPHQGYKLSVGTHGIRILASDSAGLFYGVVTLEQWLRLHRSHDPETPTEIPGVDISDSPDFAQRGVLLDVSRNRVPTMDTLFRLVDLLASWKLNQLQLYMEHTFAYKGHETVWHRASPLTGEEIRRLDAYCHERFVQLVPNQNSFGHFHRWLSHQRYRHLAECPEGIEHPFSNRTEPFSLCPTDPGTLELLADLYSQLLPNFSSNLFNVGLDETFDLGKGRSAAACNQKGRERVYLDFLRAVRKLAAEHDRQIQFWGDIALETPELLEQIPRDSICLNWGYEAVHPFAAEASALASAGLDFYVCPGTSSWNSFAGRGRNAVLNLAAAALAGNDHGAKGYLITDWGDNGHLQPPSISYLGYLAGAAFSWNATTAGEPLDLDVAALLDVHAFRTGSSILGRGLLELANAYLHGGAKPKNGTVLFHLLMSPETDLENSRYQSMNTEGLAEVAARVETVRAELASLRPADHEQRIARRELIWVADALSAGARLGIARLEAGRKVPLQGLPRPVRKALKIDIDSLSKDLPILWLARSREGGLVDSLRLLQHPLGPSSG